MILLINPINGFKVHASGVKETRILIIFDCSGSMQAKWGKETRMTVAKRILFKMLDSLASVPDLELGLRCYGHQYTVKQHNCLDSKLEIPFNKGNATKIKDFIGKLNPMGYTPIAYSLEKAAEDFPDVKKRNVILLITDGIEECGGDPCKSAAALQKKQVSLKPYVIGIGLTEDKMKSFECVGKYYSPKTPTQFGNLISGVVSNALENTTLQIFLNGKDGLLSNIGCTFSDAQSGKELNYLFTTLDKKNIPDTFAIDPNYVYDVRINTLPEIYIKKFNLQTAHHNILRQNVNLGTLNVKSNAQDLSSTTFIIKNKGNIIYHDKINKPVQLLEGRYSIEVLTMPRMYFPDRMINGNDNNISIPDPGKLSINYSNGYVGALFARREDNKEEWLTNISSNTSSNETYTLLPGNYFLVLRKKSEKSIESSKSIDFIINSNTTKSISLD